MEVTRMELLEEIHELRTKLGIYALELEALEKRLDKEKVRANIFRFAAGVLAKHCPFPEGEESWEKSAGYWQDFGIECARKWISFEGLSADDIKIS